MSLRTERVAETIREELMDIIQRDLKDPRIGITSVTHVDVSRDLKHARIFLSVLGDENARNDALNALKGASGRIRNELGKRIRLRVSPELVWQLDETIEHSLRVSRIIHEIENDV